MIKNTFTDAPPKTKKRAIVLGATADIGHDISHRLIADGWSVIGIGRSFERISDLMAEPNFQFIFCNLVDKANINEAIANASRLGEGWSLFVSSAGTMLPIGRFFQQDFDEWESSVLVNSMAQLRVLHGLWPHRQKETLVNIMLMAGGGTNSAFNLSLIHI